MGGIASGTDINRPTACRPGPRRPGVLPLLGCAQLVAPLRFAPRRAGFVAGNAILLRVRSPGEPPPRVHGLEISPNREALVPRPTGMARPPRRAFRVLRCYNVADQRTKEGAPGGACRVRNCAETAAVETPVPAQLRHRATPGERVAAVVSSLRGRPPLA